MAMLLSISPPPHLIYHATLIQGSTIKKASYNHPPQRHLLTTFFLLRQGLTRYPRLSLMFLLLIPEF
jgi:hypothetical protein